MRNRNSIIPEDYEELISLTLRKKNSKRPSGMLERNWKHQSPAMPCKTSKKRKHGETRGKTNDSKSKFACILETSESTRLRMEESLPKYHEDHIAGKGDNSLQHYNLVHKNFLCLNPWRFTQQQQLWTKNGRNLKRFRRGTWPKSEVNQRWSMGRGMGFPRRVDNKRRRVCEHLSLLGWHTRRRMN